MGSEMGVGTAFYRTSVTDSTAVPPAATALRCFPTVSHSPCTIPGMRSNTYMRGNRIPRDVLAYNIRRDAKYAQRQLVSHAAGPDLVTLPAKLASIKRFWDWCETANEDLMNNPAVSAEEIERQWRLEAVASGLRFKPYEAVAGLLMVGGGGMAIVNAIVAVSSGIVSAWVMAGALFVVAGAAFVYWHLALDRLAVGPDANHEDLATSEGAIHVMNGTKPAQPRRARQRAGETRRTAARRES